jgi:broad specificity phosphatase PhoE
MVIFLLIRHAAVGLPDNVLAGRTPHLSLSEGGFRQAESLSRMLFPFSIDAIWSSPLERALQTAGILAEERGLQIQISDAFNEVEYGEWTGSSFDELEKDPIWRSFNLDRENTRIPGGEIMTEVQRRAVSQLRAICEQSDQTKVQTFIVVTHAEVIRLILGHFLPIATNELHNKLEISLASMSALRIGSSYSRVIIVNDVVDPVTILGS